MWRRGREVRTTSRRAVDGRMQLIWAAAVEGEETTSLRQAISLEMFRWP